MPAFIRSSHRPAGSTTTRQVVAWAGACLALGLLPACHRDTNGRKPPSQVALKVNGEELSTHQVDLLLRRQVAAGLAGPTDTALRPLLDGLVEQTLAAQAARKAGLERDPQVVQTLESAKREALARAYFDRLTDALVEPSSDEIDRYYDNHPHLFSERQLYSLQEAGVSVPNERLPALKARLEATPDAARLAEVLRAESLQPTLRQVSISAEDIPLGLLDTLAGLREGQSLVIPGDGAARIFTVLQKQRAPLTRAQAARQITAFLMNERKREALEQGIRKLRDAAQVEYFGRYAGLSGPAAAVSAPVAAASSPTLAGPAGVTAVSAPSP